MANLTLGQAVTLQGTISSIYDHSGEVIVRLPDGQAVLTNARNIVEPVAELAISKTVAIDAEPEAPKKVRGK